MPQISLPLVPIELRWYNILDSDNSEKSNWTEATLALVTGRKDGIAVRETAFKVGFKSDHAIEMFGEDDPSESVEINGVTYFAKIVQSPEEGKPYRLSALQVGMRACQLKQLQDAKKKAKVINITDAPSKSDDSGEAQTA
jgi:hypothetical protein